MSYEKHSLDFRYSKQPTQKFISSTNNNRQRLVPIRIEEPIKDCFTWNVYEDSITPEEFSFILVQDLELDSSLENVIAEQIRNQVLMYYEAIEDEHLDSCDAVNDQVADSMDVLQEMQVDNHPVQPEPTQEKIVEPIQKEHVETNVEKQQTSEQVENDQEQIVDQGEDRPFERQVNYGDLRILIKIDVHVGSLYLKDQFEWPLFEHSVTPELFSKILCSDLGIGGEFIPLISHSIREQLVNARIQYFETSTLPLLNTYLRDEDEVEFHEPYLKLLNDEEINQLLKEEDRNSRRLRRQRPSMPFMTPNPRKVQKQEVEEEDIVEPKPLRSIPGSPILTLKPILEEQLEKLEVNMRTKSTKRSMQELVYSSGNRCTWCFLNIFKSMQGPLGPETLCEVCGSWYFKYGILPDHRYQSNI